LYRELLAAYESRGDLEPSVQKMRRMSGERTESTAALLRAATL